MYLNTTADTKEDVRREFEMITSSDIVRVTIPVRKESGMWLPCADSDDIVWAEFRQMTVEYFWKIEEMTKIEVNGEKRSAVIDYDNEVGKGLIFKFMLLDWNLSVSLEHDDNGWLTDDCHTLVMSSQAPLIDALATKYQDSYMISRSEETLIDRQCAILFSKNSRGVENACQAVTFFCVLGNMWEKFGINRFDLQKIPYKEYVQLRMVLSREIDKMKRETRTKKANPTRIAGPGGRTRPSRGVVVDG